MTFQKGHPPCPAGLRRSPRVGRSSFLLKGNGGHAQSVHASSWSLDRECLAVHLVHVICLPGEWASLLFFPRPKIGAFGGKSPVRVFWYLETNAWPLLITCRNLRRRDVLVAK